MATLTQVKETTRFLETGSRSAKLAVEAAQIMPDGITRETIRRQPYAPVMASAHGSVLVDVDGDERTDLLFKARRAASATATPEASIPGDRLSPFFARWRAARRTLCRPGRSGTGGAESTRMRTCGRAALPQPVPAIRSAGSHGGRVRACHRIIRMVFPESPSAGTVQAATSICWAESPSPGAKQDADRRWPAAACHA